MEPIVTIGQTGLDLIHLIAIGLVLALAGGLIWLHNRFSHQAERLTDERDRLDGELTETSQQLTTQRLVAAETSEKLAVAEARSTEDEKRFAELAQGAVRQAHSHFLDRADERFGKMVEPIDKSFGEFKQRIEAIEKVRAEDKSMIGEQVKAISESLRHNTAETGKLVTALSAPKGGGRWGETTLRNVMEHAGLSAFCDFTEQTNDTVDGQRIRPDVIIKLPGGREIVVDSKVSLDDYLKATDESDPAQRAILLKAHARNVRAHITKLASKPYQDQFSARVDFIALFIPGENFYAAALEHEPDLFDYAASKQVIVVTPSTLLALAKAVAYGWRQEQATENARQAAELGRELYTRLLTMGTHIERMGKSLNSAVESYNKMGSSLNSRVLSSARKFEELSIAPPDKALPQIEAVEERATLPDRTGELQFDVPEEDEAA